MSQSTTVESTALVPELDNSERQQLPASHVAESRAEAMRQPIYISPVIESLAPEARPSPSPACETCPLAMWYATKEALRCYSGRTHGIVWTMEDPPILKCDGRELALLQMQAAEGH